MYIPLYICIPGSCISRRFSRSLFSLFLPLSLPLAGATCALRNSSFISRVLCSAAAVRPKKFLSRPSARLLSIPPFSLSLSLSLSLFLSLSPPPAIKRKSESDITDLARSIQRLQKFTRIDEYTYAYVCEIFFLHNILRIGNIKMINFSRENLEFNFSYEKSLFFKDVYLKRNSSLTSRGP